MAKKNFEEAMQRLQEIVNELEGGSLGLDDSLKVYEEGMDLVKFCTDKLEEAEEKVKTLVKVKGKLTLQDDEIG